jgi:hypothetical protein
MLDPHAAVLTDLADQLTDRQARKAIRSLQSLGDDHLQAGVGSGLTSVWDEVCVQVQGEESLLWSAYVATLRELIARDAKKLTAPELQALWLQTESGESWWVDLDDTWDGVPYDVDDVVAHILQRVLEMAADWSNQRIAAYLAVDRPRGGVESDR